jgi:hypothetical protein
MNNADCPLFHQAIIQMELHSIRNSENKDDPFLDDKRVM